MYFYFSLINTTSYTQVLIGLNSWLNNFFSLIFLLIISFRVKGLYRLFFFVLINFFEFDLSIFTSTLMFKLLVVPLWVGTLNIHPLLFYVSFLSIFLKFNYRFIFFTNQLFKQTLVRLLFFSTISLFLGGVWGLQSLSWGYLWVNDHIEWTLLLLILFLIQHIHLPDIRIYFIHITLSLVVLITFLLLIRLNLVTTRHSFFTKQSILLLVWFIFFYFLFVIFFFSLSKTSFRWDLLPSSVTIVLFIFFSLNNSVVVTYFKYISGFFLPFFWKKIIQTFSNFKNFIIHSILILAFVFWSYAYSFFYVNFFLLKSLYSNIYMYIKVIQYSNVIYLNSSYSHTILEFVNFSLGKSISFLTQLDSSLFFILIFNTFYIIFLFFFIALLYFFLRVWI